MSLYAPWAIHCLIVRYCNFRCWGRHSLTWPLPCNLKYRPTGLFATAAFILCTQSLKPIMGRNNNHDPSASDDDRSRLPREQTRQIYPTTSDSRPFAISPFANSFGRVRPSTPHFDLSPAATSGTAPSISSLTIG